MCDTDNVRGSLPLLSTGAAAVDGIRLVGESR